MHLPSGKLWCFSFLAQQGEQEAQDETTNVAHWAGNERQPRWQTAHCTWCRPAAQQGG